MRVIRHAPNGPDKIHFTVEFPDGRSPVIVVKISNKEPYVSFVNYEALDTAENREVIMQYLTEKELYTFQ